jgi:hypothetical protein
VELRGLEPLASCMPSTGSTSGRVHLCRSPSLHVSRRPPESAPVAVLPCCTHRQVRGRPGTLRYLTVHWPKGRPLPYAGSPDDARNGHSLRVPAARVHPLLAGAIRHADATLLVDERSCPDVGWPYSGPTKVPRRQLARFSVDSCLSSGLRSRDSCPGRVRRDGERRWQDAGC